MARQPFSWPDNDRPTGIIPGQRLRELNMITPFAERTVFVGLTYGAGPAGYDIRLGDDTIVHGEGLTLGVSFERFTMPNFVLGVVHDKSTWARQGLLVQNTIIEPGWIGHLTLELTRHKLGLRPAATLRLQKGTPIAQIVFHMLSEPTSSPYAGKYQHQGDKPASAILEDP